MDWQKCSGIKRSYLIPSSVFCPTLPAWQKEVTWCIKVNNHKPLTFVVISSRTMTWLVN
ncbi:hypothetical protein [Shigella boydii]|uniref:hypothetical protein n=1 Tax=Shigella boydii TaxID=621 RepID=UPI00287A8CEB|nr:hypothetical protein [Shigella boydii]MDS1480704.1 hypothetical protein [Shigella boydii]